MEASEADARRDDLIAREAGKRGLKGKITAKCIECIYDPGSPGSGNYRQQIEACTHTQCPLYPVRPVSKPQKGQVKPHLLALQRSKS